MGAPNSDVPRMKFLVTIVNRGRGERVCEILAGHGIHFSVVCYGRGTANSDILDLLGLGETEKEIIFSVLPAAEAHTYLEIINREMDLAERGKGIAFILRIGSMVGLTALRFLSQMTQSDMQQKEEEHNV